MEVILLQDVPNLGDKGALANVSRRLRAQLPAAQAARRDRLRRASIAEFRRREEERKAREARTAAQAEEFTATLNRTVLTITAKAGEGDRLFGSVTAADIADAIWEARKFHVDKQQRAPRGAHQGGRHLHGRHRGRRGLRGLRQDHRRARVTRARGAPDAPAAAAVERASWPADRQRPTVGHVPPQNLEAEQSVLGAMLINPNAIPVVAELARAPTDFYRETHRLIFAAILALYEKGEEVDVDHPRRRAGAPGRARAGRRPRLRAHAGRVRAGGGQRLASTPASCASRACCAPSSRSATRSPSSATSHPDDGDQPARPLRAKGLRHLAAPPHRRVPAHQGHRQRSNFERLEDRCSDDTERQRRGHRLRRPGPSSPAACSRPTSSCWPRGRAWARRRWRSTSPRTSAVEGKAPVGRLQPRDERAGARRPHAVLVGPRELAQAAHTQACSATTTWPSSCRPPASSRRPSSSSTTRPASTCSSCAPRRAASPAASRLSLVIVDYLQLMVGDGRAENRQQEVANISRSLKQLARELAVPGHRRLAAQPRARGARRQASPQLSDLRESRRHRAGRGRRDLHPRRPQRRDARRAPSSSSSPSTATAPPTRCTSASCATTPSSAHWRQRRIRRLPSARRR